MSLPCDSPLETNGPFFGAIVFFSRGMIKSPNGQRAGPFNQAADLHFLPKHEAAPQNAKMNYHRSER